MAGHAFRICYLFLLVQLNGKNAVTKNGSGWGGREIKVIMERFKQKEMFTYTVEK
jgi:hypothetical protein